MVGTAAGVFLCDVIHRRWRSAAPLAVAAGIAGVGMALFTWSSHGTWLIHMHASALMPMSAYRWRAYGRDYAILLGAPHALVAVLGWVTCRHKGRIPYGPAGLGTSIAWAVYTMGKHGSGTAYWLEPTLGMIVVLDYDEPFANAIGEPIRAALSFAAPVVPLVVGAMSIPYFVREWASARGDAALVEQMRTTCAVREGEAITASDTGLEMALSDRVTWAPWATTFLVRSGAFPLSTIEHDYDRPALACFVDRACDSVTLEPVPFDPGSEHSIFRFELREAILRNFRLVARIGGECVFRRPAAP
jgi:hypothetical protein